MHLCASGGEHTGQGNSCAPLKGQAAFPLKPDPSPTASHPLSQVWIPETGLILSVKRLVVSQTADQSRAVAGLMVMAQVALWQCLPCMPSPTSTLPHGNSQAQMFGAWVIASLPEDFSQGQELEKQGCWFPPEPTGNLSKSIVEVNLEVGFSSSELFSAGQGHRGKRSLSADHLNERCQSEGTCLQPISFF